MTVLANRVFDVIAHAVGDRIIENDPLPPTARPSAAAMHMRTMLLYAAVELAFDRNSQVRTLVGGFGEVCRAAFAECGELFNAFTYGDMTRTVMLYCLLDLLRERCGDLLHGYKIDSDKLREDLPALFSPDTAEITLSACGQHLRHTRADAGMLDQIRNPRNFGRCSTTATGWTAGWPTTRPSENGVKSREPGHHGPAPAHRPGCPGDAPERGRTAQLTRNAAT